MCTGFVLAPASADTLRPLFTPPCEGVIDSCGGGHHHHIDIAAAIVRKHTTHDHVHQAQRAAASPRSLLAPDSYDVGNSKVQPFGVKRQKPQNG